MPTFHQVFWKRKKKIKTCPTRALLNCPQRKGIVSKIRIVSPKKPNSAKRKVVKVRLRTGRSVITKLKGRGHNLQPYSAVLVCGGRANDVPGVRYNLIKGVLDFGWREEFFRQRARSKYGIPSDWAEFFVPLKPGGK